MVYFCLLEISEGATAANGPQIIISHTDIGEEQQVTFSRHLL